MKWVDAFFNFFQGCFKHWSNVSIEKFAPNELSVESIGKKFIVRYHHSGSANFTSCRVKALQNCRKLPKVQSVVCLLITHLRPCLSVIRRQPGDCMHMGVGWVMLIINSKHNTRTGTEKWGGGVMNHFWKWQETFFWLKNRQQTFFGGNSNS